MGLAINTNVTSMKSARHLAQNTNALNTSFERLSSGLRINSAQDDAAGMNITTKLTSQVKGLNQATRNVTDTGSLLKTAESALSETNNLLQRLRELSVQASNDTNTAADRQALQAETNQLLSEIDRVASQVQYNGITLLDGSFVSKTFQIGANSGQTLNVSVKSGRTADLGNTSVLAGTVAAGADDGNGTAGYVDGTALSDGEITINGIASASVGASAAADDTFSSTSNSTSAIAKAAAINKVSATTGVTATAVATQYVSDGAVAAGVVSDGDITINGESITFAGGSATLTGSDGTSALTTAINNVTSKTGVVASIDSGTGELNLTAADGRNIRIVTDAEGGTGLQDAAVGGTSRTIRGGISLSSNVTNATGSPAFTVTESAGALLERLGITGNSVVSSAESNNNIATLSLASSAAAATTISLVDTAIAQVASSRSDIGALLNRLDSATTTLKIASENMSAARSQIQDVDFATETAAFSKNQILQQASSSMLAQANTSGQVALSLLGFG